MIDLESTVIDVVGKALLRSHGLTVQIAAAALIIAGKPLMRVQVKDVGFLWTRMEIAKDDSVVQIGMMHVRRIIAVLLQQCRIAIRP
ncbi:hypothetical protein [Roseovarius nanhaiticus]|uniref:hypothetical protein n=1 Tax=Roseovarius nanhaiticus TaxID=573024 RepID=UPI001113C995|nr:hypothetical protein [Roseovarius nanhaiticus]